MKKLFSFLVFLVVVCSAQSQITISSLPSHTGSPSGALVPVVVSGVTKKYDLGNLQPFLSPPFTSRKYFNGYNKFVNFDTDSITEGLVNQWFTISRARAAISLTTSGSSGAATYLSGVINIPNYTTKITSDSTYLKGLIDLRELLSNKVTTIVSPNSTDYPTTGAVNGFVYNLTVGKVNYTDTAGMLNNYKAAINKMLDSLFTHNNRIGANSTNIASNTAAIATKEAIITAPNIANYYWNGYKQFVRLDSDSVREGSANLFYTNARARAAVSLTTTGSSGAATYNSSTGALNIPNYTLSGLGGQAQLSGTGFVKITGTTISYDATNYLSLTGGTITNPVTIGTTNYNVPIAVVQGDYRISGIAALVSQFGGSGMVAGTYTNISPTGGTGTGMVLTITATGISASNATVTNGGTGYLPGDVVSVPATSLGGTTGTVSYVVQSVTSSNTQLETNAPVSFRNYLINAGSGTEINGAFTPFAKFELFARNGSNIILPLLMGIHWAGGGNAQHSFRYNGVNQMSFGATQPTFYAGFTTAGFTSNNTSNFTSTVNFANNNLSISGQGVITFGGNNITGSGRNINFTTGIYTSGGLYKSSSNVLSGVPATFTITNGGTGYTNGTFPLVSTTNISGSGTGLLIGITISGGVVTSVTGINGNSAPSGYQIGDMFTISSGIGSGTGLVITVASLNTSTVSTFESLDIFRGAFRHVVFKSTPTINQPTGNNGDIFGFLHDPTITSLLGRNIAFENTTGDVLFNSTSGSVIIGSRTNAGFKLDVTTGNARVVNTLFAGKFQLTSLNTAPSSSTDTGTTGEIRMDANYIYLATGTNTWKRVAISTF